MPTISPITSGLSASSTSGKEKPNDLKDLEIDQFLQLMIAELTNQDPLNPMDNTQLVQQIGEIRQISATTQLSESLLAVQAGQSLTTASSLIGKKVTALTDDNQNVVGVVDKVTVDVDPKNADKRTYNVHIGDKSVALKNVREVQP
ncbi:MAG: flagellar biosynthesis protein FlgD [Pirellulaceae bacterium]|nr:flagellar biosynthesis protein FlgD [Pirellulaceae bacterium]